MAGNFLMSISQGEVERARFRSRRKFQTDYQSDMATSWDNGAKSTALSIAKNLLAMGMPHDQIAAATGLTIEELENM